MDKTANNLIGSNNEFNLDQVNLIRITQAHKFMRIFYLSK